jgi:nanoRNase/pAp phosphatase (c-di-AMP/oligoRNAs hydrolase)
MEMKIDPETTEYSLVVIIDSSSPLQVSDGDISGWPKYWVIDHHPDHYHWEGDIYSDTSKGACVEIALQIAFLSGAPLDDMMAISGIAGIVADTGKFRFTKPVDMEVCSMLLQGTEKKMEDVLSIIEGEEYFDVSKKVAQLKAMRRIRFEKVGDQIVATSKVSSYEAAAARALLVAGGDVVFIAAERKDELRVSTRAKPHILKLGIHLGHFMEEIGRDTNNQGGGHDGAAGLNGTGKAEPVLQLCMDKMVELLARKMEIDPPKRRDSYRSHGGRRGGRRHDRRNQPRRDQQADRS